MMYVFLMFFQYVHQTQSVLEIRVTAFNSVPPHGCLRITNVNSWGDNWQQSMDVLSTIFSTEITG